MLTGDTVRYPLGTSSAIGDVALPSIVVLIAPDGQIAHLRDYVNTLAAAAAVGRGTPAHPQP